MNQTYQISKAIENPISIDLIENHLYLGNATVASDLKVLNELQIRYILTIDSCPLPESIRNNSMITNKYIQANDVPKEDLIQYFDDCFLFIENAIENKKNVLVHCYYGVSRSATIVISYIMKKHKLKFDKALERVKAKRKLIGPNNGFINQLRLFHRMGFKIDRNDEKYKVYRLRLAADNIQKAKILPAQFSEIIKPDPAIYQEKPDPIVFKCKNCRRILANKSNLLLHYEVAQNSATPNQLNNQNIPTTSSNHQHENSQSEKSSNSIICTKAYFFEPISWMHEITNHTQGSLSCPKCKIKLGKFNWVMSSKCPCGKQVHPAFYMISSRVEKSNVVQNVQATI